MTPFSTSIDYPFLKDRILRLWNPTVSSTRATIATQPQRGEGGGEGDLYDVRDKFSEFNE